MLLLVDLPVHSWAEDSNGEKVHVASALQHITAYLPGHHPSNVVQRQQLQDNSARMHASICMHLLRHRIYCLATVLHSMVLEKYTEGINRRLCQTVPEHHTTGVK
jgi:hypothetical protein